jgi:hypothetical protein
MPVTRRSVCERLRSWDGAGREGTGLFECEESPDFCLVCVGFAGWTDSSLNCFSRFLLASTLYVTSSMVLLFTTDSAWKADAMPAWFGAKCTKPYPLCVFCA